MDSAYFCGRSRFTYQRRIIGQIYERFTMWGQKVKVQGLGRITYAGTVPAHAEAYSTRRLVLS